MNYAPRSGIVPQGTRTVNASMYQEATHYGRPTEPINSPMNQMPVKANSFEIENFNRATKYSGIKLISNPNTGKGREAGKYFEEQGSFGGSVTTTGGKSISFSNGNGGVGVGYSNSGAKNISVNLREKGYETLREKKIIEKYP